ncbi:hypothetical protein [Kutzneria sp. CA-103260]|uniref:hypothetical protein n=1 Tax=Kutzneria sp. CA-103260 TaxID=2802641 RepID=UPI001BA85C27|nr:hypothetical protein [Kutzneria sp. CA-103260]QUQ69093.1 hypothetical protein JJ691_68470 [Kutzneria sp. CA-103260]
MSVQRKDDRHSNDPVDAIKALVDGKDGETKPSTKGPQFRIVGDLRHTDKKKPR